MKDLLFRLNKNSQNLFAEALCKVLGRAFETRKATTSPAPWKAGGRAVSAFFAKYAIAPNVFASSTVQD